MKKNRSTDEQIDTFSDIERVVSDTLRFKRKLAIGGDAYASMRIGKTLQEIWDVGGVAATGGGVAASTTVAGTFFGSWLTGIGLATAATPIGWVIGAAVASGGAYYGVTRLFKGYGQARVETIPKFINTPIDLLGASLMDLVGAFALKVAAIDGDVDPSEATVIKEYFVDEWGYDRVYTEKAFSILEENSDQTRITEMTKTFAEFAKSNPDCNFQEIRNELVSLITQVAEADGRMDEREELAIDKVTQLLDQEASVLTSVTEAVPTPGDVIAAPVKAGKWLAGKFSRGAS